MAGPTGPGSSGSLGPAPAGHTGAVDEVIAPPRRGRPHDLDAAVRPPHHGGCTRRTHRGATRPMIDITEQRPSIGARRRRLSGARRLDAAARMHLQATLARAGFHGLMVAVGLIAAVTVW